MGLMDKLAGMFGTLTDEEKEEARALGVAIPKADPPPNDPPTNDPPSNDPPSNDPPKDETISALEARIAELESKQTPPAQSSAPPSQGASTQMTETVITNMTGEELMENKTEVIKFLQNAYDTEPNVFKGE